MRFEFIADEHVKVKTFLKKHEVSKGLLAKMMRAMKGMMGGGGLPGMGGGPGPMG